MGVSYSDIDKAAKIQLLCSKLSHDHRWFGRITIDVRQIAMRFKHDIGRGSIWMTLDVVRHGVARAK